MERLNEVIVHLIKKPIKQKLVDPTKNATLSKYVLQDVHHLKNGSFYYITNAVKIELDQLNDFTSKTIIQFEGGNLYSPFILQENRRKKILIRELYYQLDSNNSDVAELILLEFTDELETQVIEINRKLASYDLIGKIGYLEILDILKQIQNSSLLKLLYISTCYYFLNRYSKVDKVIQEIFTYYPDYRRSRLLRSFVDAINLRIDNESDLVYRALFVISYKKIEDRKNTIKELYALNKLRFDLNVAFKNISTISYRDKEKLYSFIKHNNANHIVLIGHGNTTKGLQLVMDNAARISRISRDDMIRIIHSLNTVNETCIILLGCNPQVYLDIRVKSDNNIYFVYSSTMNVKNAKLFLFGFYSVFNKCYSFKEAYHAGRLCASIRGIDSSDYNYLRLNE